MSSVDGGGADQASAVVLNMNCAGQNAENGATAPNYKQEYDLVVRKHDISKGYSVSVLWRGGEIDTIYGFEAEHDASRKDGY
ncbi:MAG: hypothetical protein ACREDY_20500 [Bradyrhizobium sp.]